MKKKIIAVIIGLLSVPTILVMLSLTYDLISITRLEICHLDDVEDCAAMARASQPIIPGSMTCWEAHLSNRNLCYVVQVDCVTGAAVISH